MKMETTTANSEAANTNAIRKERGRLATEIEVAVRVGVVGGFNGFTLAESGGPPTEVGATLRALD